MRTNIFGVVLSSESRKRIAETLFKYPKRLWSCSTLEAITKTSHATVFRTVQNFVRFGLLKSTKINKKDIVYELARESFFVDELERLLRLEKDIARRIAETFIRRIKSNNILCIILYGSSIKGVATPESDIDMLVVTGKNTPKLSKKIQDEAANISSEQNKTVSATILTKSECADEKNGQFIKSVKENSEVLYGKEPF